MAIRGAKELGRATKAGATRLHAVDDAEPMKLLSLPIESLTIGDDFRLDEDPEALAEMAASMQECGVLQALLVRPTNGGWEVVAGRRRLAAARIAGLETVPCIVKILGADESLDAAFVENLHRRELSAIEEALAYARMKKRGLSQAQIARKASRSQVHISTLLRLLELPKEMQAAIHEGKLAYTTALRSDRKTGKHQGGTSRVPSRIGDDEVASHWRRRHDRLIAALTVLARAPFIKSVEQYRELIQKVLQLDNKQI